jgi:hypothetical protein
VDGKLPEGCYPLRFAHIQSHQLKDRSLKENTQYSLQAFHGGKNSKFQLYADKMGKIVIPKSLQKQCWQWYHDYLVHPGFDRTYQSIADTYTWDCMHGMIKEWCHSCDRYQWCKTTYRQYGLLPPKQAEEIPWECLCVVVLTTGLAHQCGTSSVSHQTPKKNIDLNSLKGNLQFGFPFLANFIKLCKSFWQ